MDRFERAAQTWSAAESITRSGAVIESKLDLDPSLLDAVDAALKTYLREMDDEGAFDTVLEELAGFLRAAVEAKTDNT